MLLFLLACDGTNDPLDGPFSRGPATTDLQLEAGFVDDLTWGYACTAGMVGPIDDHGVAIDTAATHRLQLEQDAAVVFVGSNLDTFFDDDNCDDLVSGFDQRVGMAYTMTSGTIERTEDDDTRSYRLIDAVFTPDPQYDFDASYADADAFEPVALGTVDLALPLGNAARPLE